MAEFGIKAANLQGASLAGSSPIAAVGAQPIRFPSIDGGLKILADALKPEDKSNKILGNLQRQLSNVAQGIDSGALSGSEGNTRVESIMRDFYASTAGQPELLDQAKKIYESVTGFTSIKGAQSQKEDSRKLQNDMLTQAVNMGMVDASILDASEDQKQVILSQMLQFKDSSTKYDLSMKTIQLRQAEQSAGIAQAAEFRSQANFERDRVDYIAAREARGAVGTITETQSVLLLERAATIRGKIDSGELTLAQGQAQLRAHREAMQSQLPVEFLNDNVSREQFTRSLDNMFTQASNMLDPAVDANQWKAQKENMVTRAQLGMFMDPKEGPEILQGVAASNLFGNMDAGLIQRNNNAINRYREAILATAKGEPNGVMRYSKEDQQNFFNSNLRGYKRSMSSRDPQVRAEGEELLSNAVKTTIADAAYLRPTEKESLYNAAKFVSSPEVGRLAAEGKLTPADFSEFGPAYTELFENSFHRDRYTMLYAPASGNGNTGSLMDRPLLELVEFSFDGNQFKVIPNFDDNVDAARERFIAENQDNPNALRTGAWRSQRNAPATIKERIAEMNVRMAPLATHIKALAHMLGTNDYKKFFEENAHKILPGFFIDPANRDAEMAEGWTGKGNPYNPRNRRITDGNGQSK